MRLRLDRFLYRPATSALSARIVTAHERPIRGVDHSPRPARRRIVIHRERKEMALVAAWTVPWAVESNGEVETLQFETLVLQFMSSGFWQRPNTRRDCKACTPHIFVLDHSCPYHRRHHSPHEKTCFIAQFILDLSRPQAGPWLTAVLSCCPGKQTQMHVQSQEHVQEQIPAIPLCTVLCITYDLLLVALSIMIFSLLSHSSCKVSTSTPITSSPPYQIPPWPLP